MKFTQIGTVQAAVLTPDGRLGLVASKTIVGLAPTGWKVVRDENADAGLPEFPATNAIDADAWTFWRERATTGLPAKPGSKN